MMATNDKSALTAMAAGYGVGMMGFILLPIWIGAAVRDLNLVDAYVGWLAAAHLGGVAAASLGFSVIVDRLDRRRLAMFGAVLALAGNLASVFIHSIDDLMVARVICGLGEGVLLTAISAAASGARNPVRAFTIMSFGLAIMAVLAFPLMPRLIGLYGAPGAFGLMAVAEILCIPALLWLPSRPEQSGLDMPSGGSLRELLTDGKVLLALVAYAIFYISDSIIWPFLERIGAQAGLSLMGVSILLAVASVISLAAPVAAHALGLRLGRAAPIAVGTMILALNACIIADSGSPYIFSGTVIVFAFLVLFITPYILEIFSSLDPKGRVAGASPAFMSIGNALGPMASALILEEGMGFKGLGYLAGAIYILSAIIFTFLALKADKA